MLLEVEPAVFDADNHVPVIAMLTMVAKGRHDWRPATADAIRAEAFVRRLTAAQVKVPALVEWARKAVEEASYQQPGQQRPGGRRAVPVTAAELEELMSDLEKAAVLVVENRLGDGAFVRTIATGLGDQRIVDALARRWLRFSNGGGCGQMPELAAEERREFKILVRVAVLFDSDRDAAGQHTENEARADLIKAAGVPEVHVLRWRMMENYLPFRVWEHHFPNKPRTATLRAMIPRQRAYLHLKKEFVGKKSMPSPLLPAGLDLVADDFAELGEEALTELRELLAMLHRIL